jgi:hypothetical protein
MAKGKQAMKEEMTLDEAKAYRASLYIPTTKALTEKQKRNEFKLFWAKEKKKYKNGRSLEEILWLHLKNTKQDEPASFEKGLQHFGLKKIK